jgi:type IV pilus assembly protein PilY1
MNNTRYTAKLLILSGVISSLFSSTQVQAQRPLSDLPPLNSVRTRPNIIFTLDNSGSMAGVHPSDLGSQGGNANRRCYTNVLYNPLYFDPLQTYLAPIKFDGSRYPSSTYTAAWNDGFTQNVPLGGGPSATTNLSSAFGSTGGGSYTGYRRDGAGGGGYYHDWTGVGAPPGLLDCRPDAEYTRRDITAMQQGNFANWFSYYRTRLQAVKSATGAAFANYGSNINVGFQTINNPATGATATNGAALNIANFDPSPGAAKETFFDTLYRQRTTGGTPLVAASIRAGEYYLNRTPFSGTVAPPDPITDACQSNYHILTTDGFWNSNAATPGNNDATIPNAAVSAALVTELTREPSLYPAGTTAANLASGQPYRRPIAENSLTSHNLADVSAFYWATDLRTTGTASNNDRTPSRNVSSGGYVLSNPATWQNMVTHGLAFGALGQLSYQLRSAPTVAEPRGPLIFGRPTVEAIRTSSACNQNPTLDGAGARVNTPPLAACAWPVPAANTPSAVDDLWHAAVAGRGVFGNVASSIDTQDVLNFILADAASTAITAARAGVDNPVLTGGDQILIPGYIAGDWTGNIVARNIDQNTAVIAAGAPNWCLSFDATKGCVSGSMEAQFAAATAWDTDRRILTRSNGVTVPLRLASLTTALQNSFDIRPTPQRQQILNYIRGDRSNELPNGLGFRARSSIVGDIINSEPQLVTTPNQRYTDLGYDAFKAAQAMRTPMVYVGSNAGMIHAINATNGRESWAYLPSALMRSDVTGVGSLAYLPTAASPYNFTKRYFVDGTPVVRDVDFERTTSNPASPILSGRRTGPSATDWRTVLVTGLGKGGRSYVALDVTTPPANGLTEAGLATSGRVLWEFTHEDLGFTYGKPYVVKTKRYGWVALLPGGYNNTLGSDVANRGKGTLFVVDIRTGTLLHTFRTNQGTATSPAGLAHIEGLIPDETNFTVTQLYAGDLLGNVWRYELDLTSTAYASSPTLFAQLRDPVNNNPQPVTTVARPAINPSDSVRYVFVGTGKLLDRADVTCGVVPPPVGDPCLLPANRQRQTLYTFKDGDKNTPVSTGLPIARTSLASIDRATVNTTPAMPIDSYRGWMIDLPLEERNVVDPIPNFGVVVFSTITTNASVCNPQGFGTAYARGYRAGDSRVRVGANSVAFFGGTESSANIAGVRFLQTGVTAGRNIVGTITTATGEIGTINITFPTSFLGVGVNYREILN